MRRQRSQTLKITFVGCINRIVRDARRNKIVIIRVEFFGMFHAGRGFFIDPQRLHPRMPDVTGVGSTSHAGKRARHGTPVTRREELPLAEGKEGKLVNSYEKKFGALILVNVRFALAISERRG